jgi:hypothetical protein
MPELLVTLLALLAIGSGPQAARSRYGGDECGASVESPHKLKHERQPTAGGTATMHHYSAKVRGTLFRLFCGRDASITAASDDLFASYRDGFLNDDPSQLVEERVVTLNGAVGREIHGAEPDGTHSIVRVFIVPGGAFGAMVSGSKQAVLSEEARAFLDSLQLER